MFGVRQRDRRTFQPLLQPGPLLDIGDVHVLHADRAAIGIAQHLPGVAQRHLGALTAQVPDREMPVEVPNRQPMGLQFQVRVAAQPIDERVDVRRQVPQGPVRVNELHDPGLLVERVGARDEDVGVPE